MFGDFMDELLEKCDLCPRHCLVNRKIKQLGYCKAPYSIKTALAKLYYYEEPPISGTNGSGTIFFSNCNLNCLFCQNFEISHQGFGKEITIERFKDICLELQNKGAHNINLVTPTSYVPQIVEGLKLAKQNGLIIPIVYNTNAYENIETIKLLDGLIDIYLPDLKYYSNDLSIKYSNADNYFNIASMAIKEMYKQVGKPRFDNNGIIKKGVIVRHLILPNHLEDTKTILEYLYKTYHNNIYISIMNQYTPIKKLKYENLNHELDNFSYNEIINYAYNLGIRKAFVQEEETQEKSFIPLFNNEGV